MEGREEGRAATARGEERGEEALGGVVAAEMVVAEIVEGEGEGEEEAKVVLVELYLMLRRI